MNNYYVLGTDLGVGITKVSKANWVAVLLN